jgi:cytochrome c oxidase subunit 3
MATGLLPPPVVPSPKKEEPLSGHNGNGPGGGDIDYPRDDRRDDSDPDPERWATPLGAYRTASLFVVFSILSVFATLTHVLETRWVHSKDWVSIALPRVLYINTAVLIMSSLTMELARTAARRQSARPCARWLLITLLLGLGFVVGQLAAWRALVSRGLYVASNPGSFFFYFLTATHALHLVVGIVALAVVTLFSRKLAQTNRQQTAVAALAIYWHFLDGLWLYLFALLLTTIQR